MAAANFSRDVLENFYGEIPQYQRPRSAAGPPTFEIERNDFNNWLRVWKMRVPRGTKDIFRFFQTTKNQFVNVCRNEVREFGSVKVQFGLLVRFYVERNGQLEYMVHYFKDKDQTVMNQHNADILNHLINLFIDHVKGEIEGWSEKGSGWVVDEILEAFINVARYTPLRGGTYIELPHLLKNKKAIINVKNKDNMCLRWALRAHLFPARTHSDRSSSYPTNDGLNFAGIDFPTPVSQIDMLERHKPECKGLLNCNKDRDDERGRKQDGLQKLLQTDEGSLCGLRRL